MGTGRLTDVRALMTAGDNLIIILMWDVMNSGLGVDGAHTLSSQTQTVIANNNTAKGQSISIHYREQHITTCAFISATEVNALQGSLC